MIATAMHRYVENLHAIYAWHIEGDAMCFVALRRRHQVPFFMTSMMPGPHAIWGDFSSRSIHAHADFASWLREDRGPPCRECLVSLWIFQETWYCVWEKVLDLRHATPTLVPTTPTLPCVVLSLKCQDALEYFAVGDTPSAITPSEFIPSFTWQDLEYMARIQSDAHHTKDAERLLALRCTPALQSNSVLTQRRYKFELRHSHDLLRRARRNREQALSDLYDTLEARQKALGEKQQQLQAIRARMKTIRLERTKLSHDKDLVLSELNHVQKEVGMHRARLLRDLDDIYPIQLVHARDLLYSIVDLPLPNGIATTKENTTTLVHRTNLDETSAALTYVAQLMILLSTYLHTTLPYPLTSSGSRATVQDRISIMTGPRSCVWITDMTVLFSPVRITNCTATNMPSFCLTRT